MTSTSISRIAVRHAHGQPAHRGCLAVGPSRVPCTLGWHGITANKREGDRATPAGNWPLRRVFYRADRIMRPATALDCRAIRPDDGWCDDPGHRRYNRAVKFPFTASAERMWRDDRLYDIVVVLGHNDRPPVPGRGSAIFFHLASPDYGGTEGCIAVSLAHMRWLLARCDRRTVLSVG